jgi:hypothetical protein
MESALSLFPFPLNGRKGGAEERTPGTWTAAPTASVLKTTSQALTIGRKTERLAGFSMVSGQEKSKET